jgi:hypothetical protein
MNVYFGNKKINRVYSGDKELIVPTTEASLNTFTAEYLLIAEGGTGASSGGFTGRGGGGAGGLLSGSLSFTFGTTYNVVVDTGGGNSTFRGLTASAGGRGGNTDSLTGLSGGSGGGYAGGIRLTGGTGVAGQGFAGGGCGASNDAGGGGGGADGAGGFGSGNPGGGGAGKASAISGVLTYYAGGGGGGRSPFAVPRDFGDNGLGGGNSSYGGGSQASGTGAKPAGKGVCIVRYRAPQKATGGTITTDGDYIIHTFNWPNAVGVNQPFAVFPKGG